MKGKIFAMFAVFAMVLVGFAAIGTQAQARTPEQGTVTINTCVMHTCDIPCSHCAIWWTAEYVRESPGETPVSYNFKWTITSNGLYYRGTETIEVTDAGQDTYMSRVVSENFPSAGTYEAKVQVWANYEHGTRMIDRDTDTFVYIGGGGGGIIDPIDPIHFPIHPIEPYPIIYPIEPIYTTEPIVVEA
ncbi:MAG: hypothetical protein KJ886_01560 [Candidatus Thermoplasmatota archaeon]|nr:hypothetical protein [Candidatus Thermoplasmatota archaeon]MCG2825259.1 hypothetical protein [Thermoplasmatales archaeon]